MERFDFNQIHTLEAELLEDLEREVFTSDFELTTNPNIPKIIVTLALQNKYPMLYTVLKHQYITQQSNIDLQYKTLLAAYAAKNYQEAFFLAKDLLVAEPRFEVIQVLISLCVNHLALCEYAVTYANIGLKHFPADENFVYSLGVSYSLMGDNSLYVSEKQNHYNRALSYFESIPNCRHMKYLLNLGLVQAKLGNTALALKTVVPGYQFLEDEHYTALLALLLVSNYDFTEALELVKSGLQKTPDSTLLRAVK